MTLEKAYLYAKTIQQLECFNADECLTTPIHRVCNVYSVPMLTPKTEDWEGKTEESEEWISGVVVPLGYVIRHYTGYGKQFSEIYRAVSNHDCKASAAINDLSIWCDQVGEDFSNNLKLEYRGHIVADNEELGL